MLERIAALSTVHRKLYQSEDVAVFDVSAFIRDIAADLVGASGRSDIALIFEMEPVLIPATRAAPVALVVNELLTNALKHAFPFERPGQIRVSAHRSGDRYVLEVKDDGVGCVGQSEPSGFGQSLVELLSRQLGATIERNDANPGLRASVTLPVDPAMRGIDGKG